MLGGGGDRCCVFYQVDVKVIGLNDKGKVRLSRRAVIADNARGPSKGRGATGQEAVAGPRTRPLAGGLGVVDNQSSSSTATDSGEAVAQAEAVPFPALVDASSNGATVAGSGVDAPPPGR